MINSKIANIRSKTEKRQIIQYLLLRGRILHDKIMNPREDEDITTLKKRHSEVNRLIDFIRTDTIDSKIREMHQYIHKQNDYTKLKNKERKNE